MHLWDLLSPWFSASDKFSLIMGGVPTPAMIFPLLWEAHVNNHLALGVSPPNTDMQTPCQVGVTPHESEGIKPFTTVNSLACQVGVTPRNPEGIEPFTLVNSLPDKVRAMPLHLINTPSGPHKVSSSVSSQVPASISPSITTVMPPSVSVPVLDSFPYDLPSVMSPPCPLPPDTPSAPLKTTQATIHEQPVDLPIGLDHLQSTFIEVNNKDLSVPSSGPP